MDDYSIKANDWIPAGSRFYVPQKANLEPKIDELVSQAVGKKVYMLDPRLLKLVVKWKKESGKDEDSNVSDNFLQDPRKISELKETFKND